MRKPTSGLLAAMLLITGTVIYVPVTEAAIFNIKSKNPPQLKLKVGKGGHAISLVEFDVPAGQVGNGIPVIGNQAVDMQVDIRATPAFSRVATLTVDSSNPLTNGSTTLLMSNISWVAADGDIPSGSFDNTTNQFLMSHPNSFQINDTHDFSYANTQILEAGTYSGRVTYTLTMP